MRADNIARDHSVLTMPVITSLYYNENGDSCILDRNLE
jgi:hypothetical protein